MSEETVAMTHPDVEGVAEASRQAFEELWQYRGWVEVTADVLTENMKKDQLEALATEKGVDTRGAKTKADLAAAIAGQEDK